MSGLTEEQKLRIEENKKKALARLAERRAKGQMTSAAPVQGYLQHSNRGKGDNCGDSRQVNAASVLLGKKASMGKDNSLSKVEATPLVQGRGNDPEKGVLDKTSGSCLSGSRPYASGSEKRPVAAVAKPDVFYGSVSKTGQNAQNQSRSSAPVPKSGNVAGTKSYTSTDGSHVKSGLSVVNPPVHATVRPNLFNSVKGKCVLFSREHFKVEVGFHAAMVEVFKTMKTKQYGE